MSLEDFQVGHSFKLASSVRFGRSASRSAGHNAGQENAAVVLEVHKFGILHALGQWVVIRGTDP